MVEYKCDVEEIYYLVYNDIKTVFHFGKLENGQVCSSGLDKLETFTIEEELKTRVTELTDDVDYYDNYNKKNDIIDTPDFLNDDLIE